MEADHEDSSEPTDPEEGERDEDLALVFCCPRHSGIGDVKMETIMQVCLAVSLSSLNSWLSLVMIVNLSQKREDLVVGSSLYLVDPPPPPTQQSNFFS